METEETRALIEKLVAARAAHDREQVRDCLAEDVEWIVPIGTPMTDFHGRDAVADGLIGGAASQFFDPKSIHREITMVLADGDKGAVRQHVQATTRTGDKYDNHYSWFYVCEDGKIAKIFEYLDTLVASRTLGFDLDDKPSS